MFVVGERGLDLSADDVLAILRFVWPTFIQVEDCVLVEDQYFEDNYESWRKHHGENWLAIEAMINHIHIRDCFQGEKNEEALLAVGRTLEKSWRAAALEQFPSREVNVLLSNDENDYGPTLYLTTKHEGLPTNFKDQEPHNG